MTLQEYLETKLGEMASQDPNFRERYEDKKKSMKDCLLYVTQQARKQAIRGCAAISDEDVLQKAVHYYQGITVPGSPIYYGKMFPNIMRIYSHKIRESFPY